MASQTMKISKCSVGINQAKEEIAVHVGKTEREREADVWEKCSCIWLFSLWWGAGKQQEKVPPAQVAGALLKITFAKVIGPVQEEEKVDNDIGRKWMPAKRVCSSVRNR